MWAKMLRVTSALCTSSGNQVARGNIGFLKTLLPFSLTTMFTKSPSIV
jgi:hypothetical protein